MKYTLFSYHHLLNSFLLLFTPPPPNPFKYPCAKQNKEKIGERVASYLLPPSGKSCPQRSVMPIFQKHPHNFKFVTNRSPYRSSLLPSSSARRRRVSPGPVVSPGPAPPNCLLRRRTRRAPSQPRTRAALLAPSPHRTCSSAAKDLHRPACSIAAQDVLLRRPVPAPTISPPSSQGLRRRRPVPARGWVSSAWTSSAWTTSSVKLILKLFRGPRPQAGAPSAASPQLAAPPLLVLPPGAPLLVCCRPELPCSCAAAGAPLLVLLPVRRSTGLCNLVISSALLACSVI